MVPPVIRPSATSMAPRHKTNVIAPNISAMTIAVIIARSMMRLLEAPNVVSTLLPKRSPSRPS